MPAKFLRGPVRFEHLVSCSSHPLYLRLEDVDLFHVKVQTVGGLVPLSARVVNPTLTSAYEYTFDWSFDDSSGDDFTVWLEGGKAVRSQDTSVSGPAVLARCYATPGFKKATVTLSAHPKFDTTMKPMTVLSLQK
jgi:hypothetical protein